MVPNKTHHEVTSTNLKTTQESSICRKVTFLSSWAHPHHSGKRESGLLKLLNGVRVAVRSGGSGKSKGGANDEDLNGEYTSQES